MEGDIGERILLESEEGNQVVVRERLVKMANSSIAVGVGQIDGGGGMLEAVYIVSC